MRERLFVRGGKKSAPRYTEFLGDTLSAAAVPAHLEEVFLAVQRQVARYFSRRVENPAESHVSISGERYILVRASSMSVDFFELVASLYQDSGLSEAASTASALLFDVGHAIARSDARTYHQRLGLRTPDEKMAAGPVLFSFSGWAFVRIDPSSHQAVDESFYLLYDHPFSFEADAWVHSGKRSDFPVCVMSAGYSSGWAEESCGLPMVATEVECIAAGGRHCRFILSPTSKIEQHVAAYREREHLQTPAPRPAAAVSIPEFFQRKRLEEELRRSHAELEEKVRLRTLELEQSRRRLVTAQEAERRRLEGQIHDGVQQDMVSLLGKIRLARNQFERNEAAAGETLVELQRDARGVLQALRGISASLYPPLLRDQGLVQALRSTFEPERTRVHVQTEGRFDDASLSTDDQAIVFFAITETVTVLIRCGVLSDVDVRLSLTGAALSFTVRAHGCDPGVAADGSAFTGVRDWLNALDGVLDVQVRDGMTTVEAALPLPEAPPAEQAS